MVHYLKGRQDQQQPLVEPDINDGTDHLANLADRAFPSELIDDLSGHAGGWGCRRP